jgi:hypothetical protein
MNVVAKITKINYLNLQKDSPGCLSSCGLAGEKQIEACIDVKLIPSLPVKKAQICVLLVPRVRGL